MTRFTYHGLDDKNLIVTIKVWDDGDIVGTIMLRKGELLPEKEFAEPHTECAQVAGIDVVEKYRRQGYATKLYEEAARLAASHGLSLCSDITSSLNEKAEAFWYKQRVKGKAIWEVPGTPENEDRNFGYGRYVLQYPPPESLD